MRRIWRLLLPNLPEWYTISSTIDRRMTMRVVSSTSLPFFQARGLADSDRSEPGDSSRHSKSSGRSWPTCVFALR